MIQFHCRKCAENTLIEDDRTEVTYQDGLCPKCLTESRELFSKETIKRIQETFVVPTAEDVEEPTEELIEQQDEICAECAKGGRVVTVGNCSFHKEVK